MTTNVPTVGSQLALASTQATVTQATSPSTTVAGQHANTLITTQTFSNAPGFAISFAYTNPLITSPSATNGTAVAAAIVSSSGGNGNPVLSLSGQASGVIYITITNLDPSLLLNQTFGIAVLVYPL